MLPIVIVILLAIVGFGVFFSKSQTMTDAVTAAARFEATCRTQTAGDAAAVGTTAAGSLSSPLFTFKYAGPNTSAPHGALCGVPSGSKITVLGTAGSYVVQLGFYSFDLPITSSVTITEA